LGDAGKGFTLGSFNGLTLGSFLFGTGWRKGIAVNRRTGLPMSMAVSSY